MKRVLVGVVVMALFAMPMLAGEAGKAGCCKAAGVERSVANLDNGVKITITTGDPKMVAHIQEQAGSCSKEGCGDCPMMSDKVTRTVDKTDNGVVITATSADAAMVKALQTHAAASGQGCARGKTASGGCAHGKGHTQSKT